MNQLRTVMWKEFRELRAEAADLGPAASVVTAVVLLLVVGGLAAMSGPESARTFLPLVFSLVAITAVLGTICEAFAGERERHTLETLLASRLSNEAILGGKILLQVLYGWACALLLPAIFVIGANARSITTPWTLPSRPIALAIAVLTPLVLLFFASAGALVSLRSATVREAASKVVVLFMAMMIPFIAFGKLVPLSWFPAARTLITTERGQLLLVMSFAGILAVADVALIVLAWFRFRRDRLIEIR